MFVCLFKTHNNIINKNNNNKVNKKKAIPPNSCKAIVPGQASKTQHTVSNLLPVHKGAETNGARQM